MIILLIIAIPASIALTGFLVLKSVQLGLRWQIQAQKQEQPTMEIKNPIQPIIETKQAEKQEQYVNQVIDEWLNGSKEKR